MLEYRIDIENEQLERALKRWQRDMPDLIRRIFALWSLRVTAKAQENLKKGKYGIMSGGNGRTGRLANSVFARQPRDTMLEIGAGAGVRYATPHESGFNGTVTVRQHTRSVVFGRKVPPFTVPSFTRQMNVKPKWYMRNTLQEFFRGVEAENIARGAFNAHKRKLGFD